MDTLTTNFTTIPRCCARRSSRARVASTPSTRFEAATVYNWSVGVQRELPCKFVADVAYVGNTSTNISRNIPINDLTPAQLDPNPRTPTRRRTTRSPRTGLPAAVPGYGGINERQTSATRTYHSIQVSVNRRLSNGLAFSVAYTGPRSKQTHQLRPVPARGGQLRAVTTRCTAAGRTISCSTTTTRSPG